MTNTINKGKEGYNGYKAFYRGKQADIYAKSSYNAQQEAAIYFKAKKSYEVSVILCELAGTQVLTDTSSI